MDRILVDVSFRDFDVIAGVTDDVSRRDVTSVNTTVVVTSDHLTAVDARRAVNCACLSCPLCVNCSLRLNSVQRRVLTSK